MKCELTCAFGDLDQGKRDAIRFNGHSVDVRLEIRNIDSLRLRVWIESEKDPASKGYHYERKVLHNNVEFKPLSIRKQLKANLYQRLFSVHAETIRNLGWVEFREYTLAITTGSVYRCLSGRNDPGQGPTDE